MFLQMLCLMLSSKSVFAQNDTPAKDCNCLTNLNLFIKKIESNYVGYKYKIIGKESKISQFTDSLRTVAKRIGNKNCIPVLHTWANFFDDPHVSVFIVEDQKPSNLTHDFFADEQKIALNEEQVIKYLNSKNIKDIVEGIWLSQSGKTKVAIIRDKTKKYDFIGFTLKADTLYWSPGEIRMQILKRKNKYETIFYDNSRQTSTLTFELLQSKDKTLLLSFLEVEAIWKREYPKEVILQLPNTSSAVHNTDFRLTKVNEKTLLLSLPSFEREYRKKIDSLIENNLSQIKRTPNLIIDVRNNGGGSVFSYEKILPLLYTNPIIKPQFSTWATEDNITLAKSVLQDSSRMNKWDDWRRYAEEMEQHKGKLYEDTKVDTIRLAEVYKYPSKIAVLTNQGTASAAEFFLLDALQSSKVKIFGTPTAGIVTFVEYVNYNSMPCAMYNFVYPIAQNNAILKNGDGRTKIQPTEIIADSVRDWIKWTELRFAKW